MPVRMQRYFPGFPLSGTGNTENAQDADRVKVLYVKDKEGNEIAYDETSRTVRFENPGLYVVRVSVKDSENRQTVADITIPVEEQ